MIPEGKAVRSEMTKGRTWEVRGACTQTQVHGHRALGAVPNSGWRQPLTEPLLEQMLLHSSCGPSTTTRTSPLLTRETFTSVPWRGATIIPTSQVTKAKHKGEAEHPPVLPRTPSLWDFSALFCLVTSLAAVALNYISLGCTQQFNSTRLRQVSRLYQISGQCGIRKDQGRGPTLKESIIQQQRWPWI